MELFHGQDQGLSWATSPCLSLPGTDFGASSFGYTDQLVSHSHHSLHFKEVQSSTRAHFCSVLTILRSWPHTSWWLLLILFIWVSIQSLPLLSLQNTLILFLYFFWTVGRDTSSVSEQERQSPEAMSRWESAMFPFDGPKTEDIWSSVLSELPVTALLSGSAGPLVGLEEGLKDCCLCCLEPVLVSGVKSGVWSLPCVELCSLLTSTSGEVTQALLVWEWSHFPFGGMARYAKGHPTNGVPARGMSGKEDTGWRELANGGVRTPDGPGTGEPWGSGSGAVGQGPDTMEMPSSCWAAVIAALLI